MRATSAAYSALGVLVYATIAWSYSSRMLRNALAVLSSSVFSASAIRALTYVRSAVSIFAESITACTRRVPVIDSGARMFWYDCATSPSASSGELNASIIPLPDINCPLVTSEVCMNAVSMVSIRSSPVLIAPVRKRSCLLSVPVNSFSVNVLTDLFWNILLLLLKTLACWLAQNLSADSSPTDLSSSPLAKLAAANPNAFSAIALSSRPSASLLTDMVAIATIESRSATVAAEPARAAQPAAPKPYCQVVSACAILSGNLAIAPSVLSLRLADTVCDSSLTACRLVMVGSNASATALANFLSPRLVPVLTAVFSVLPSARLAPEVDRRVMVDAVTCFITALAPSLAACVPA